MNMFSRITACNSNTYRQQKTLRAFTLIELLVVIAIIGILSTVVLASLGGARGKARDAKRVAELKGAQAAIELFYDACGQYPATFTTGASNGCPAGTPPVSFGTFMSTIPVDPKDSASYTYYVDNTNYTYVLKGTLESSNSALDSDKDGNVTVNGNTVNCEDNVFAFCLVP